MKAVDGLSLAVGAGETVALVGESGCGKSLSALSIMRLLPDPPARIVGGAVKLNGRDIVAVSEETMLDIRGKEIGMIFQDPMSSLNPVTTVEKQIAEVLTTHTDLGRGQARARAHELLDLVGMPDAARRLDAYPHQLSGGMCQRVVIAMAIACSPSVLIADEPTTALDVTVQAQVLALLKRLQADAGMAMIFITHDLGVVAETADRVVVMYAGRKVEEAPVDELFETPLHPYTAGLIGATPVPGAARAERLADIPGMVPPLNALPQGCAFAPRCPRVMERCRRERPALTAAGARPTGRLLRRRERLSMSLLALHDVHVRFNTAGGVVRAVNGVSLELAVGETLGLVGESGCGKSTLGKAIMKLVPIAGGEIMVDGVDIAPLDRAQLNEMRRKVQMIFQDPYGSLNPRSTVGRSVAQPLVIAGWKTDATDRAGRDAAALGRPAVRRQAALSARILRRPAPAHRHRPRAGAQSQAHHLRRAGVGARRVGARPGDQPPGGPEGPVRRLLPFHQPRPLGGRAHRRPRGRDVSRHPGRGGRRAIRSGAIRSTPTPRPCWPPRRSPIPRLPAPANARVLQGELPSPLDPPAGCPFHSRCPIAQDRCKLDRPMLRPVGDGALAACHFV